MTKQLFLSTLILLFTHNSFGQDAILPLWEETMPNHQESDELETKQDGDILWIEYVQEPTLEVYLPTKRTASDKAIIICPGGGYQGLAYDWEGTDIAKWLNSNGITAFVLKYRLPISKSITQAHEVPLRDAQRAIRLVRNNVKEWGLATDQIGIMGFSAGGHLASTLGSHYDQYSNNAGNEIDALSARPDFMILIYPVITMNSAYTHAGSRINLLGENPSQEQVDYYSNELHVNENTPPTFIVHSTDDKVVPVDNAILFYQALVKEDIYSEMHIYPEGGHGYGLAIGQAHLQTWTKLLIEWISSLE